MSIRKFLLADNSATDKVLANLRFPLYSFPKLDGVRGGVHEGAVYSRNLKLLANRLLQNSYGKPEFQDFDGEFIVGDAHDKKVFNKTMRVVSAHEAGIKELRMFAFDHLARPHDPYYKRLEHLKQQASWNPSWYVHIMEPRIVHDMDQLFRHEDEVLELGFEGLILRDPEGVHKPGRSTLREHIMLKLKRFSDDEAVVIGFEEKMHNANEKTLEKNGKAARSSHAAGLVPLGTLGALVVRWRNDITFNIGSGFDHAEAQEIWDNRDKYMGQVCTFKYFDHGIIDKPRHPVFKGWRPGGI